MGDGDPSPFSSSCFESLLGAGEESHLTGAEGKYGVLEASGQGLVYAEGTGVCELELKSP